ncbi:MAG: glutamate--tRNA ligase [Methylophaga sp.]
MKTKTRFAPSPTGFIHLGNTRTALFNALLAIRDRGTFLLRIEDTDKERSRSEYVHGLMEDLRWLGLDWQEGPEVGGEHEPYLQSEREDLYQSYYDELAEKGLTYPCFCSDTALKMVRKSQIAAGQPPRYTGTCRNLTQEEIDAKLAAGEKPALRFKVPENELIEFTDLVRGEQRYASQDIGDFIIRRQDGSPAFFFSNAIDDALMGVSHVLRGDDHLSNTPRQMMLMHALNLNIPQYGHISMVVGPDNAPLSKRHGSRSVKEMRASGYFPGAVVNYLARLGHSSEDNSYQSLEGLAALFKEERLGRAPARFDLEQLHHWQQEALNHTDDETLWQWMGEQVHQLVPADKKTAFMDAVRPNILFPDDALHWASVLFGEQLDLDGDAQTVIAEAGTEFYQHALAALSIAGIEYKALMDEIKQRSGAKGKGLFLPVRIALTGQHGGPELGKILALMGQDTVQKRLEACLAG